MNQEEYTVTFADYLLHWLAVFAIGLCLWFGAKIEGNKARYDHYQIRKNLRRMFRKMRIEDLEK